jgi:hypothetical protein
MSSTARRAVTVVTGAPTKTSTTAAPQPSRCRIGPASARACVTVGPGGGAGGVGPAGGTLPGVTATPPDAVAHSTSRRSWSIGSSGLQSKPHDHVPSARTASSCVPRRATQPPATAVVVAPTSSAAATVAAVAAAARGSRHTGAGAGVPGGSVVARMYGGAPLPLSAPAGASTPVDVPLSVRCSTGGDESVPTVWAPHPRSTPDTTTAEAASSGLTPVRRRGRGPGSRHVRASRRAGVTGRARWVGQTE